MMPVVSVEEQKGAFPELNSASSVQTSNERVYCAPTSVATVWVISEQPPASPTLTTFWRPPGPSGQVTISILALFLRA